MMMRKSGFLAALLAVALAACGGGDDAAFQQPSTPTNPVVTQVASLSVTASSPTLPSDNSAPVDIKVYARNANNQFMSGVPVTIAASSGGVNVTTGTTDANGQAAATLSTAGDPTRRTITVTATSGTVSSSVSVQVGGSTLSVQGDQALSQGATGSYTITLADAKGVPFAQPPALTVTSARSNTLSASSVTPDASGKATVTLRVVNTGNDTITIAGAGLTASQAIAVSSNVLTFSTPAANAEIPLNSSRPVTVNYRISGAAAAGQTVTFSTTRGTVSPTSVVTDASGNATTAIQASNAGGALVTATSGSTSGSLAVEFVATTPSAIDVQPSSFSIATTQSSTITAVVRDVLGNLVKNQTVTFSLNDVSGGTLSRGTAVTDSQGRAQSVYTASSTTSANQGVRITASVNGISQTVALTVARRELFISLGTGNTITKPNDAIYNVLFAAQVTDANGVGVANVPLSLRLLSMRYIKGFRSAGASTWGTTVRATCDDEDANRNGILDQGEDFNGNGRIDAGNIASVAAAAAATDSSGQLLMTVAYPQQYAGYVEVELSASSTVQGTEYVRSSRFVLSGAAADFNNLQVAPPGPVSPFGQAASCSDPT